MKTESLKIHTIPSLLWGEKSDKVFISVHGNMSHKKDTVIQLLAEAVTKKGYQVLSFDLPEHGDRKNNKEDLCKVQNCVRDLKQVMEYAKSHFSEINLWACSMGAYFSLLAYREEDIQQCLFLSPVVNMKYIIDNMMLWSHVTEKDLKEKQEIPTNFGQVLYWDYYQYVIENPIIHWNKKTSILYGSNDTMQDEAIIKTFCQTFHCKLSIMENGEHFFHTKEQLDNYKEWLEKSIANEIFC